MALNPDVQRRAHEELDKLLPDQLPTIGDRQSTPYLNAVLKETLRWHPSLPLGEPYYSKNCSCADPGPSRSPASLVKRLSIPRFACILFILATCTKHAFRLLDPRQHNCHTEYLVRPIHLQVSFHGLSHFTGLSVVRLTRNFRQKNLFPSASCQGRLESRLQILPLTCLDLGAGAMLASHAFINLTFPTESALESRSQRIRYTS